MSLTVDFAARRADLSPGATALLDDATGAAITFAEVEDRAARLATAFRARGLCDGARIAVLCRNSPAFFVALFAAQKAGAILAPLNWRQPVAELAEVCASVSPAAILHDETSAESAQAVAVKGGMDAMPLDDMEALTEGQAPCPSARVDEDAPWYLLFTSGTTGTPKAVIQTARMALANALNVAQSAGLVTGDRHLNFLPLFHTAGINLYTMPVFLWGGTTRIMSGFDPGRVLELIGSGEVDHFFGVPAIYQALSLQDGIDDAPLGRVRSYGCGGAAMPEAQFRFFAERGALVQNGFGMTETGPMGFLTDRIAARDKIGSIGKPQFLTEACIAGAARSGEATGELLIRGPSVTPGYYGNEAATRAAFDADGWLKSGDVARRDADSDFYIVDRIKDMFISGGENVYPAEIERVLLTHPDILDAAVIGTGDAKWGEVGFAFLIPRPGCEIDTAALDGWCRERLARYKTPVGFRIVEDFPRTAAGKVRKPLLKQELS